MPPKKGAKQRCAACCNLIRSLLTLSIPTFFLWSGLVYLATTAVVWFMRVQVNTFICDIYIKPAACADCASDNLMCAKDRCYQSAMNITIATMATSKGDKFLIDLQQSSRDEHCLRLVSDAKSVVDMGKKMHLALTNPTKNQLTTACVKSNCQVLYTAVTHPDLVLAPKNGATDGCTNTLDSKQPKHAAECPCNGVFSSMEVPSAIVTTATVKHSMESICAYEFPITTTTTTTSTTAATTTIIGGASVRRLDEDETDTGASARRLDEDETDTVLTIAFDRERRLAHAVTPQATVDPLINAKRADFTVGLFGKCTCYQQCQPGIMTRVVTCQSTACMEPIPPVSVDCSCEPCAACSVMLNTLILMITLAVQGVLSLLVWLGIVWMNAIPEGNLVSLTWGQWFLGIFVKRLPFWIRICVLINLGQALYLLFQTFIPPSFINFQPDCNNIPSLQVLTIAFTSVMAFQLLFGVLAKLFNRMYPYLFKPVRDNTSKPIRIFNKLLRSLGP